MSASAKADQKPDIDSDKEEKSADKKATLAEMSTKEEYTFDNIDSNPHATQK